MDKAFRDEHLNYWQEELTLRVNIFVYDNNIEAESFYRSAIWQCLSFAGKRTRTDLGLDNEDK